MAYGKWQHGGKNKQETDRHEMACTRTGGDMDWCFCVLTAKLEPMGMLTG